jgi:hypothetical protein
VIKTKKLKKDEAEELNFETLPVVPPEVHFLADRYVVKLPLSDPHLASPWDLRVHVAKILTRQLGDEIEMDSLKVKKPHLIAKSVARLRKQEPCARAYVTIKF